MSTAVASDMQLLEAWRAGDANAGDALVRRHYGAVLRFFEVRSRAPEDLTQRTFLACVEGRERFRGDASLRTYLFAIARRVLLKHMAEQSSDDRMARFAPSGATGKTSVSMLVARKHEQRLLLAALATLPEDVQTVLVLHYWEGMRAREIGEVLEAPTSTVTTRLARAREALRKRVERLGARQPAGASLLADIDGWTRSLADPSMLAAIPAGVPAALAHGLLRRG